MDWFERITGFSETGYDATRRQLKVEGHQLRSLVNGKSYRTGESLNSCRYRICARGLNFGGGFLGRLKVTVVTGDVRKLHLSLEYTGALFQVASQFNLLEMTSPSIAPEQGVTHLEMTMTGSMGPCATA